MNNEKKEAKTEVVIFRASPSVVRTLDRFARWLGVGRSEALRRVIPDLSKPAGQKGTQ